jgi:NRPS condensation-like uncharacterized protein
LNERKIKRKLIIERVFLSRPDSYAILAAKVNGIITVDGLESALQKLRQKYPIIGTRVYIDEDHSAWLVSEDVPKILIKLVDMETDDNWIHYIKEEYKSFFPLKRGPLIRLTLIKNSNKSILIISGYHLLVDGISLPYLLKMIMLYLEDPESQIIPLLTPPVHEVFPLPMKLSIGQKLMNKLAHFLWKRKEKRGMAFSLDDYNKIHSKFCPMIYDDLNIINWSLNEKQTSSLVAKCKQEGVTITTAICTAFLKADHEIQTVKKSYINKILLPINIRNILTNIPEDAIGLYVSTINVDLKYHANIGYWDLARISHKIIQSGLEKQNILNILARAYYAPEKIADAAIFTKYNVIEDKFLNLCLKVTDLDRINYSYSLSNLGKYDFPKKYGNLELEEAYFHTYGEMAEKQLNILTIGDILTFSLAFRTSIINRTAMESIKEVAMKYLLS